MSWPFDRMVGGIHSAKWGSERIFHGPFTANALPDHSIRDASYSAPLGNGACLAIPRQQVVIPAIIGLFSVCAPFTVLFAVSELVIYAVNSKVVLVRWTHVLVEILKRFLPAGTDCYATAAVVVICGIILVTASPFHVYPDVVYPGTSQPVLLMCICGPLSGPAPARGEGLSRKVPLSYNFGLAAVTSAHPVARPAQGVRHFMEHKQHTKSAANKINFPPFDGCSYHFSLKATAACTTSRLKGQQEHSLDLPTLTLTEHPPQPLTCTSTMLLNFPNDSPPAERLSNEIHLGTTDLLGYAVLRHGASPTRTLCLEQPLGPRTRRLFAFYHSITSPASIIKETYYVL